MEPLRRSYTDAEADKVVDLFGGRGRWGTDHAAAPARLPVPGAAGFAGECEFDLVLPLSYDVDVAAHKYLAALEDGVVPLLLLFSGTVFTGRSLPRPGSLSVQPVPWHKEATVRMPVAVWREAMDAQFPGQAWLRMSRATYDELVGLPRRLGLVGWDDVLHRPARAGRPMSEPAALEAARAVADAVLYEGYVLYPYRASAPKNRVRWQWGVLMPDDVVASATPPSAPGTAPTSSSTGEPTSLRATVRFLQVQRRYVEDASGDAGGTAGHR